MRTQVVLRLTPQHGRSPMGFTLLELLAVVAVLGILAGLLLPALNNARLRARSIQCSSQLRQAGLAFHSFAPDHEGSFPWDVEIPGRPSEGPRDVFGEWMALSNYLDSAAVLHCPADKRFDPSASFAELTPVDISYTLADPPPAERGVVLWATDRYLNQYEFEGESVQEADWAPDRKAHHGPCTGNVLLSEGSVHTLAAPGLRQALSDSLRLASEPRLRFLRAGLTL